MLVLLRLLLLKLLLILLLLLLGRHLLHLARVRRPFAQGLVCWYLVSWSPAVAAETRRALGLLLVDILAHLLCKVDPSEHSSRSRS